MKPKKKKKTVFNYVGSTMLLPRWGEFDELFNSQIGPDDVKGTALSLEGSPVLFIECLATLFFFSKKAGR
jgi:hypothetical protein